MRLDSLTVHGLDLAAAAPLLLAPLLIWQGRRVRREVPAVAPPEGHAAGICAAHADGGPMLRLLVCGESTAAGIGAPDWPASLGGRMAESLAAATKRRVEWRALARNGMRLAELRRDCIAQLEHGAADVILLAIGANDAFQVTGARRWQRQLDGVIADLRAAQPDAVCLLSGLPPVWAFPGLPQPLRFALGLRARLLDFVARTMARTEVGLEYVPIPMATIETPFCEDGIHPSAETYRVWGAAMAHVAARRISDIHRD